MNLEDRRIQEHNRVDPSAIHGDFHDYFPKRVRKMAFFDTQRKRIFAQSNLHTGLRTTKICCCVFQDLSGGYLGDGFPLCTSLPAKAFLRMGAKYIYRGRGMDWPFWPPSAAYIDRVVPPEKRTVGAVQLTPTSALYQALCMPDANGGVCQFPSELVLSVNLPCDGPECDVDTVRVVQVQTPTETIYYEYVPAPCVEYAFFENGKFARAAGTSRHAIQCFNPEVAAAGTTCVNPGRRNQFSFNVFYDIPRQPCLE
jgi:hypothetical protein